MIFFSNKALFITAPKSPNVFIKSLKIIQVSDTSTASKQLFKQQQQQKKLVLMDNEEKQQRRSSDGDTITTEKGDKYVLKL